jgi:hypothetical protein
MCDSARTRCSLKCPDALLYELADSILISDRLVESGSCTLTNITKVVTVISTCGSGWTIENGAL